MSENTKIEWADHTFNPWVGCTKISLACDLCYAERWAKRSGMVEWGGDRRRTSDANWAKPIKWNKQAEAEGRRYKVFCASLADVFDNQVPPVWRADLFQLIRETPNLDWLLLTKRIGNVETMLQDMRSAVGGVLDWDRWPLPNVWIGATVCNQAEAGRDIPKLLAVPASKRFLSIEPLLGPVNLDTIWNTDFGEGQPYLHPLAGRVSDGHGDSCGAPCIDWVIVGGESGPHARPMHPDWARSLRDQCTAAAVPFLFKQWGEWADERHVHLDQPIAWRLRKTVSRLAMDGRVYPLSGPGPIHYAGIYRVGKRAAGRLLDGVQHDGSPD